MNIYAKKSALDCSGSVQIYNRIWKYGENFESNLPVCPTAVSFIFLAIKAQKYFAKNPNDYIMPLPPFLYSTQEVPNESLATAHRVEMFSLPCFRSTEALDLKSPRLLY